MIKLLIENYGQHTGYSDSCNGYSDSKYQHLRYRSLHIHDLKKLSVERIMQNTLRRREL
jgi:hypothetical protein